MTDWSYLLFVSSIYAFGSLGLFGVSLLPLRAFLALRRNASLWHSSVLGKTSLILVGTTAIAAIANGIPQIAGVFPCLTDGQPHGFIADSAEPSQLLEWLPALGRASPQRRPPSGACKVLWLRAVECAAT